MNVVLIGSGNVATHLGLALNKFYNILQVYSPQLKHAQCLANQLDAQAIDQLYDLKRADVYIMAVKDSVIAEVAQQLAAYIQHSLLLHTSGSVDMDVLQAASLNYGVLYPLQTFSIQKAINFQSIPLLLESSNPQVGKTLDDIAKHLSPLIYHYSSAQRRSLHLGAVIACNFSNYLYSVAEQYLTTQGVEFDLLKPLIVETAHKVSQHRPFDVQTGPAVRGDLAVLEKHSEMLAQQPDLQQLYRQLSDAIIDLHVKK